MPTDADYSTSALTVTLRNRHGLAPDVATFYCADREGSGDAIAIGSDGTGTGTVPPGESHLLVRMLNRAAEGVRGEFVGVAREPPRPEPGPIWLGGRRLLRGQGGHDR